MSGVVVFCGPSLRPEDRARHAEFTYLPPASQGDVHEAARSSPRAIGIVDGYFDGAPAVWHKEILWALSRDIAVFGASSMGALRAAELHPFGMVGIGRIFEGFRDGRLTGDDEVALVHGPAGTGYLALSEPMVNVRATVERARQLGVADDCEARELLSAAERMFYQERTWPAVIKAAAGRCGLLQRFAEWLPQNRVDLKRQDALLLLGAIGRSLREEAALPPARVPFELTEAFAAAPWFGTNGVGETEEAILDELRLQAEAYALVREKALLLALSAGEIERTGTVLGRDEIARATAGFRLPRGLVRRRDVEDWAARNGMEADEVGRLVTARAAVDRLSRVDDRRLHARMLDVLRLEGRYALLRERASRKSPCRGRRRAERPLPIPPAVLLAWHFEKCCGAPVPDDVADHAASLELADVADFHGLLADEYVFLSENDDGRSLASDGDND